MNILIVDDEENVRAVLRTMLQLAGHHTVEAANGVAALEVLRREPVDAIISDIMMPRMDGYRLCQAVREDERLKNLPFIFHTATYTSSADEKLAFDLGADLFLRKPAPKHSILEAVRRVTGQPRAAHPRPAARPEAEVMREYSDRLVAKLEQRNLELAAAEAKFRALVEGSLAGIYIIQEERFVYVNPRMAEIFGWSEAEMTARPLFDFILPEDQALARENIRRRISGEVPSIRYELRMLHQSGAVRQVEVLGNRAEYGGKAAVMGMLLDVTERRRVEQTLQQAEAKYRGIFENAVEGILQTTLDGRILTANPAFARMLGYESAAALLAASLSLLRDVYVNPQDRSDFLRQMEGREVCNDFQCPIKRRDGRAIWVSFNARPTRDASGTILYYDATCMDITERRQAEEALKHRAAELERFHRLSVGRELQMIDLKKEVNELAKLAGRTPPYELAFLQKKTEPQTQP